MSPSTLRVLLIATLLAVQLATVALFAVDAGRRVSVELETNARTSLAALAETVRERSVRTLVTVENRLRTAARVLELGAVDTLDAEALERLFVAELEGDERVRAIFLGRPDGSFLSVARVDGGGYRTKRVQQRESGDAPAWLTFHGDAHGRRRHVFDHSSDYDPRERPWYRLAEATGGVGWTDPYPFFSNGRPGISMGVPVRGADGGEIGVLGVDVELGTLSDFVGRLVGAGTGSAALVDEWGHLIAASGVPSPGRAGETARERLPRLEDVDDPALHALAHDVVPSNFTPLVSTRDPLGMRLERFEVAGAEHLGLALPVRPSGSPSRWSLLVQVPVDGYAGGMSDYFVARGSWLVAALFLISLAALGTILGITAPVTRIHRDATVDRLTGAFVRAEFERRLALLLEDRRVADGRDRIVVAALDLDGFKAVNDTHGHGAGDEVLGEVVERLHGCLRPEDLVGRAGGDEFLVAMRLPASADVHAALERVRSCAVDEPVAGESGTYDVGVTVGVAARRGAETLTELLTRADRTLIDGKAFEKNRVYVALEEEALGPVVMAGPDGAANADEHESPAADTRSAG